MSIPNVKDASTRNEFRAQDDRLRRLESQISQVVKNSTNITQHSTLQGLAFADAAHTGFASSAQLSAHTGDVANPHVVTFDQAAIAGDTSTVAVIFNEGVTFGATVGNQTQVALKGKNTSGPQRRGGSLEWYTQNDVVGGYTYLNGNLQFVFDTAAQANRLAAGNAWVECDTGNASFATLTATGLVASSLTLGDSELINFGAGTDMTIQHNATDNLFTSNVRTAASDEVGSTDMGFRLLHDTNTTSSVGENTGSGRFGPTYNEATAVVELAVDAGGAEHTFGWISAGAAAHRGLGNLLPCLVFHNNDNATLPWSKGFACGMVNNSDSNFTGILSSAETRLDFYADNVKVFRADSTTGLILGEAAAEGKIGTQAASTLILESDDPPAGQPWVFVRTKTDQTGSGATHRAFAVHHNLPSGLNYPLFTVWPSDQGTATYGTAQIAVHADGQLCFDAANASNGTTRGDTYFVYDSANATADFFHDGSEVWNADGTEFNVLDILTHKNGVEHRYYDSGDSNYVGFVAPALTGNQIWTLPNADGNANDTLMTDGAGALSWKTTASEKAWAFESPSGSSGVFYYGGYYDFAATDNDFNPVINWGTANKSYAAHFFVVAAAGGAGGTDTVIRITGTSIDDTATRAAADTEDLTLDDAGAAGAYYESTKKWIGLVTVVVLSGPDLLCNYGWCKYWDNNNTDFTVAGLEAVILAGANDTGFNLRLLHHRTAGWTYNAGSTPTPPAPIAGLQADHVTEFELANGQNSAWKRSDLSTAVSGSTSEGTIWEVTTTANKSVETGNILMRITS